jgi:N-acetylneuraminate synthase/N,N'-diacetyllegionaminate synthase
MTEIDLGEIKIGNGHPVFIIAEIGINHNGDVEIAKEMIRVAKKIGANAVKFQLIKTDMFCSPKSRYYSIFKNVELKEEDFQELLDYSRSQSIIMFTASSQLEGLDFIEKAAFPLLKVGSPNITNIPLLERISRINRPVILSTGMSTLGEVEYAVNIISRKNPYPPVLLHCVSNYPTDIEETNLLAIKTLRCAFPSSIVGFSDHTRDSRATIIATALGAKVIEKHFTLDKKMEGHDHWFSSDPEEFKQLVEDIRITEKALGTGTKRPQKSELKMIKVARRYIVAAEDISAGEIIQDHMIDFKRVEGIGIEPRFMNIILGRQAKKSIKKGEVITWEMI